MDAVNGVDDDVVYVRGRRDGISAPPAYDPDFLDVAGYAHSVHAHYGYPAFWAPGNIYPG